MGQNWPNDNAYKTIDLTELQMAIHQLGVEVLGRYIHDPDKLPEIRSALGLAFDALLQIDSAKQCRPGTTHRMSKCVPDYFAAQCPHPDPHPDPDLG